MQQPIDRRDGNTKGECGITTVGCLFCKDQIAASSKYVANYEKIQWDKEEIPKIASRKCTACGFIITEEDFIAAAWDYVCPECGRVHLRHFRSI
jgi:predicted RNA-binding Zn-ribbon protein involved in translation (DUF1610 family)